MTPERLPVPGRVCTSVAEASDRRPGCRHPGAGAPSWAGLTPADVRHDSARMLAWNMQRGYAGWSGSCAQTTTGKVIAPHAAPAAPAPPGSAAKGAALARRQAQAKRGRIDDQTLLHPGHLKPAGVFRR